MHRIIRVDFFLFVLRLYISLKLFLMTTSNLIKEIYESKYEVMTAGSRYDCSVFVKSSKIIRTRS